MANVSKSLDLSAQITNLGCLFFLSITENIFYLPFIFFGLTIIIIIIIIIISSSSSSSITHSLEFFTSASADGFPLEFEWQQVSSSLQDSSQYSGHHHAVVWMVSTRPSTSKSSKPFNNPLVTLPKAPITIGTIVTFMFHSFFNSLARSRYLPFFFFTFFQFYSVISWNSKVDNFTNFFFCFFCWLLLGLIFGPRLGYPCIWQSPIGVYVHHFLGQVLGCAHTICSNGQI